MQHIADWLKKVNLPEYAECFAENGIDVSVLPHLTDQDLKDMGGVLGRRRKMFAAIGELSSKYAAARALACDGYTYRAGADPARAPKRASRGSGRRTPLPQDTCATNLEPCVPASQSTGAVRPFAFSPKRPFAALPTWPVRRYRAPLQIPGG